MVQACLRPSPRPGAIVLVASWGLGMRLARLAHTMQRRSWNSTDLFGYPRAHKLRQSGSSTPGGHQR